MIISLYSKSSSSLEEVYSSLAGYRNTKILSWDEHFAASNMNRGRNSPLLQVFKVLHFLIYLEQNLFSPTFGLTDVQPKDWDDCS